MRLIDADALENKMYHEAFENDASYNERNPMAKWDSGLWIRYKMFENVIDEQPTIEPKRGEWIYKADDYDESTWECSNCKEPWTLIDGTPQDNNMKFCPNCGADMKGADDEKSY